jgi:hypothetical protein
VGDGLVRGGYACFDLTVDDHARLVDLRGLWARLTTDAQLPKGHLRQYEPCLGIDLDPPEGEPSRPGFFAANLHAGGLASYAEHASDRQLWLIRAFARYHGGQGILRLHGERDPDGDLRRAGVQVPEGCEVLSRDYGMLFHQTIVSLQVPPPGPTVERVRFVLEAARALHGRPRDGRCRATYFWRPMAGVPGWS